MIIFAYTQNKPMTKLKKRIALLGASEYHIKLYEKAKALDLEVHCIAWAKDACCRKCADYYADISVTDQKKVLDYCHTHHIDAILSNALEITTPTIAHVCHAMHLPGVSLHTAQICDNKQTTRRFIQTHQLCTQPHYICLRATDPIPSVDMPVIVKPIDSCGGRGITIVRQHSDIAHAIQHARLSSPSQTIIIEEYIEAQQIEVDTLSYHGQHQMIVLTDIGIQHDHAPSGQVRRQPSHISRETYATICQTTTDILDALHVENHACFLEFLLTSTGQLYLIEIAAHGSGAGISYHLAEETTSYDYISNMIRVSLGQSPIHYDGHISRYTGIYFQSTQSPWVDSFAQTYRDAPWMFQHTHYCRPDVSGRQGHFIYSTPSLDTEKEIHSLINQYTSVD